MKRMFRIQRMFLRQAVPALLAAALLLASTLPAAAAGGTGRGAAVGSASWRGFLAEVSAWLGGRVAAGLDLVWGEDGSSIDPNGRPSAANPTGGTATTWGEDGSSFDPNGRATTNGDGGSSIDPDGRP
jgi:hypothetical protein